MFRQRMMAVAATTALVVGLGGCSLVQVAPEAPLTGIAACALGKTWTLDTAKMAEALQTELASRGITATVTADGSQSFAWDLMSKVKLDTDYTVTVTSGPDDQKTVLTSKHSGASTGIAYISSDVAIPRDWDGTGLKVDTTATLNGEALEALPYTLVQTDIDDSVGIELTCDGGTMTTHQRGSDVTLTWAAK